MDGRELTRPGSERAALIIAHPGHELRVHRWLETARPLTFVLTKGDGRGGASRVASTTWVLERAGASVGAIYGRLEDVEIYAALLRCDHALFGHLLDELTDALVEHGITLVAADAEEGYSPSHDVCRYLATSATALAARRTNRTIRDLEFPLEGPPDACPDHSGEDGIRIELDDEALQRKLAAARSYPELQFEVTRAIDAHGTDAFRVEHLRPATVRVDPWPVPPFYEEYGRRQVALGRYPEVITYREHLLPVRTALWARAGVAAA